MNKRIKITSLIIVIIGTLIFGSLKTYRYRVKELDLPTINNYWGITFSKKFASSLGLDWRETYIALLDEMGVKTIRLPIYWDNIEHEEGVLNFADYDWMFDEGAKRGVKFIPVIGRRVPRWPECHVPEWSKNYSEGDLRIKIERMLRNTVKRYRDRKEIIAWQLENEYFLDSFGECPPGDLNVLKKEFALVKSLDRRPIIITGSGELSDWSRESSLGDAFGATLYRVVWSQYLGYTSYPWPPQVYTTKAYMANLDLNNAYIAELQAEPWAPNSTLDKLPDKEKLKSFSIEDFKANLQYAANTQFKQVWLWGAEWWYMEKIRGNSAYWDLAKTLKW